MPIFLLLLLTVVCLLERFPPAAHFGSWAPGIAGAAGLTWSAVAISAMLAWVVAYRLRRSLVLYPEYRDQLLHRYASLRFYHLFLLIGTYAVVLYYLGWGWVVERICAYLTAAGMTASRRVGADGLLPGAEILLLAPFLTALILSWACFYDADRAIHETGADPGGFWTRSAYLWYRVRQNLALLAAPLGLMIVVKALQHSFADGGSARIAQAVAIALVPAVFISFPWILRIVLGLKPLPEGPLRERLMNAARRLHFRCSNVLLWDTHGTVANAVVAGVLPLPRYVLFTDRLLAELSTEELEAVFGHEVGHIKHHHIPYYVGFLLVSMCAVACLWGLATDRIPAIRSLLPPTEDWTKVPFVGVVGAYIFLVFGFLSRRCERQADIFGCRAVSCLRPDCPGHDDAVGLAEAGRGLCPTGIRTFIGALEKVDRINHGGMSRGKQGWLQAWQHSTVSHRVQFLQRLLADPNLERRFQRRVSQVKWLLALGLSILLTVLVGMQGWSALFSF